MKKLISILGIILAFIIFHQANAAQLAKDAQDFPSISNLLVNAGFENGSYAWTASGGATKTADTTAAGFGKYGYEWDSNASSQTLTSNAITIPPALYGKNGVAYCSIETPSGSATHTLAVTNGSSNIVTPITINSSSTFARTAINFVFPTSGSVQLQLTSVASNEPDIYIDNCYVGEASNVQLISQAQLYGTVTVTACSSNWSTTSTSFAAFGTQTSCSYATTGNALAPSTNVPGIKFSSMPPGEYILQAEGDFFQQTSGKAAYLQFSDGTNTAREISVLGTSAATNSPGITQSINYSSTQSNVTLQIFGKTDTSGTTGIEGVTALPLVIKVYYFPSQAQTIVSSSQGDYDWTAYTPTISAGFGTATNISFYHKRVNGDLLVKGTFTSGTVAASIASISLPGSLTIDSTRTSISNTTSNPGPAIGTYFSQGANNSGSIVTALGTSTSLVYFGGNISGATPLTPANGSSVSGSSVSVGVQFVIPISGWNTTQRAPTLVNSVLSNTSGTERIERAYIANGGSASITSQSGSWVSSVTRNGTGDVTVNITSGEFSSTPVCSCTAVKTATAACAINSTTAPTSTVFRFITMGGSGSAGDLDFTLICMGPH